MSDSDNQQTQETTIPLSALVSQINSSQVSAQRVADHYARSGALDVCQYDQGYKTQLVFACLTCRTSVSSGFCLACSMHCHVDHEVIETGKKRNFRCDCGTERLPHPCQLTKKPEHTINDGNQYNQNFMGLFCHCSRPYDPETETKDMIMCCRCQDWFHDHADCIGEAANKKQSEGLYLCASCVKQAPLLISYCTRTKSDKALAQDPQISSCTKPQSSETITHGIYLPVDLTITICRCDDCLRAISEQNLQFIIEELSPSDDEDDNEDGDIESSDQELKPEFDPEFILDRALSRLPRELAIEGALKFRQFTDNIILGLKKITANDQNRVITVEDVNSICASVLGKRNRDQET